VLPRWSKQKVLSLRTRNTGKNGSAYEIWVILAGGHLRNKKRTGTELPLTYVGYDGGTLTFFVGSDDFFAVKPFFRVIGAGFCKGVAVFEYIDYISFETKLIFETVEA